jgi:hypothetical protein
MDTFQRLAAPFPPQRISWRVGTSNKKKRQRETGDNNAKATKGQALAYIDARDVMDRLDEVVGPAGWRDRYVETPKGRMLATIEIKVEDEWVAKSDGAGDTDIEGDKGGISDSFKRAAVKWGIGRYLYNISSPWVELDEWEHIKPEEFRKLEQLLLREGGQPAPPVQRDEPPPTEEPEQIETDPAGAAIHTLETFGDTADNFKECWSKNQAGWKRTLTAVQYARVVAAMKAMAAKFTPPKVEDMRVNGAPPPNDFGLSGDAIPQFN